MERKLLVIIIGLTIASCNDSSNEDGQAVADKKEEVTTINTISVSQSVDSINKSNAKVIADSLQDIEEMKAYEAAYKIENYLVSSIPNKDFTIVSENAGVLIGPDSLQIVKMKKEMGEEDFYIVADDNIYYDYEASEFLNQKKFKLVYPKTRYIKFVSKGKEYYFDSKSKAAAGWTAVLFSPSKPTPRIINTADIEGEFKDYMK
jgi:hypothetical protein